MFKKLAAALCAMLLLTGCTVPRAEITPEGYLEVFGPATPISRDNIGDDWIIEGVELGEFLKYNISSSTVDGSPSLSLKTGKKRFALMRRVRANLLAAPFLSWSWKLGSFTGGEHPVRLIVGFHGGDPKSGSWGSQPLAYIGTDVPPHDRVIALTWDADATKQGTVSRAARIPRYIAHGGAVTKGWTTENIDLAALYKRLWPRDEHAQAQVMFVGFSARSSGGTSGGTGGGTGDAHFADIILSK